MTHNLHLSVIEESVTTLDGTMYALVTTKVPGERLLAVVVVRLSIEGGTAGR